MISAEAASGVIFVMIGPGGAGKNAIMKAIIKRYDNIAQLATATTRAMRPDEVQGREHLFLSTAEFQEMLVNDQLLEHQEVTPDKFYGIPRQTVINCLQDSKILIADIEVLGARKLVAAYPHNVVQIFVTVPGETIGEQLDVLEQRMRQRDDGATDIQERLERAQQLELPYQGECRYILVNDNLEHAIAKAQLIIRSELKRRGLHNPGLPEYHRQLGARLAPDDIPLDYGDRAAEYDAAIQGAIVLDRSHEGRILLEGESRFELVNRMSTNQMLGLSEFEGRATVFTNANGRILFRALCYNLPRGLLVVSEAGQGSTLADYLRRNIFFGDQVSVRDLSAETAQFGLHGANADSIIDCIVQGHADSAPLYSMETEIAGQAVTVARRKSIAGGHWALICSLAEAVALHRHLLEVGAAFDLRPAGSLTYNLLRIRSGRPAGLELSADYIPLEVGLWDEVSFEKGCYTGQEIIARMESRQRVAKLLVHMSLSEYVAAPAQIFAGERSAGRLTSCAKAPDGQVFALAVLKREFARPGAALQVGDKGQAAQVAAYAGEQPAFLRS